MNPYKSRMQNRQIKRKKYYKTQAIKIFLITVSVQSFSMKDLYSVFLKKSHLHVDLSVGCLYFYCRCFGFCQTSWRSKKRSALLYQNLPGDDQYLLTGHLVLLALMAGYIRAL